MRRTISAGMSSGLVLFCLFASAQTTSKSEGLVKDKYRVLQVDSFDVQQGVELPPGFLIALPQQLTKQLKDSKKFEEVLAPGEKPSQEDAPALRLTGTVTGYDQGNRGKRYLAGQFGAGNARMFVTVKYLDRSSGQLIYEDKVIGTLTGGAFGGSENQVVEELARAVAATTKIVLLINLHDSNRPVENAPPVDNHEANADRQIVDLKGDLALAESRMNGFASQGYRLSDFKITGNKSAQVTMEKVTMPPAIYQYILIHAYSPENVQKNMNKAAVEGYRLTPHTLAALGKLAVIMEKPPVPSGARYEYRVSTSMRQSNAEKHLIKDQQEGFALAETGQVLGLNVVITEKAIAAQEASR